MKDSLHKDIASLRIHVKLFLKNNYRGKSYPSPIGDIKVTTPGIHEAINQPHKFEFEKNRALYELPELLKTSEFVSTAPDKEKKFRQYHYLKITIADEDSYINVREHWNGDKTFHSITQDIVNKKG